jgi:hypothetical protein
MKYTGGIIFIVLFVLVTTVITAGCSSHTHETTTSEPPGINSVSAKSANGLKLYLALDAKTFKPGYALTHN